MVKKQHGGPDFGQNVEIQQVSEISHFPVITSTRLKLRGKKPSDQNIFGSDLFQDSDGLGKLYPLIRRVFLDESFLS